MEPASDNWGKRKRCWGKGLLPLDLHFPVFTHCLGCTLPIVCLDQIPRSWILGLEIWGFPLNLGPGNQGGASLNSGKSCIFDLYPSLVSPHSPAPGICLSRDKCPVPWVLTFLLPSRLEYKAWCLEKRQSRGPLQHPDSVCLIKGSSPCLGDPKPWVGKVWDSDSWGRFESGGGSPTVDLSLLICKTGIIVLGERLTGTAHPG